MLGVGAFGRVYLGLNEATGELMAVKRVHLDADILQDKARITALDNEIELLRSLDNEYIVKCAATRPVRRAAAA